MEKEKEEEKETGKEQDLYFYSVHMFANGQELPIGAIYLATDFVNNVHYYQCYTKNGNPIDVPKKRDKRDPDDIF